MRFDVFTLFPEAFTPYLETSILQRARQRGLLEVALHNIRDWTSDKHHVTDDEPYGGGGGMVMKPEPIFAAVESVLGAPPACPVILLTPQGRLFNQSIAFELAAAAAPGAAVRALRRRGRARAPAPGERRDLHRRLRADRRRAAGAGVDRRRDPPDPRRAGRPGRRPGRFARLRAAGIPALHPPARVPRLEGAGGARSRATMPASPAGGGSRRCCAPASAARICCKSADLSASDLEFLKRLEETEEPPNERR